MKDYKQASEYYQQNLVIKIDESKKLGTTTDPSPINARNNLAWSLFYAGNFAEAEREFITNLEDYEKQEVNFLQREKGDLTAVEFSRNSLSIYTGLQKLRVKQGRYEEALEFSERGRTRYLAYSLSGQNEPPTVSQIQEIAKEQNVTVVEYSTIRGFDYDKKDESELFIWVIQPNGQIHFRQIDLTSVPIKQTFFGFKFVNILRISILFIGISASIFFLKQNKKLSILGIAASCLAAVLLPTGQNSLTLVSQVSDRSLSKQSNFSLANLTQTTLNSVRGGKRSIVPESLAKGTCEDKEECLQQLHRIVIQPITELLPKNSEEQVIFIPEGYLFRVPFPALKDLDNRYLIEKHTTRTASSIQLLKLSHQQAKQRSGSASEALVVGNPLMPSIINSFYQSPSQSPESLSPLPATEQEAKEIAQLLGVKPLIGKQATESAVVKLMPNARIIHFATHGLLDVVVPSQRGVNPILALTYLKQYNNNDWMTKGGTAIDINSDDGLLTPTEIYNLNLKANLVVLSACDTGLGEITSDGVVGLARPFIARGVPSVVVSLWQIPDAPTLELMVDFYNNLKSNPDKAQALRQAMLTTMKKYPDPFNWAAFTLVGEAQ